jgi:hypothetical protein
MLARRGRSQIERCVCVAGFKPQIECASPQAILRDAIHPLPRYSTVSIGPVNIKMRDDEPTVPFLISSGRESAHAAAVDRELSKIPRAVFVFQVVERKPLGERLGQFNLSQRDTGRALVDHIDGVGRKTRVQLQDCVASAGSCASRSSIVRKPRFFNSNRSGQIILKLAF